MSSKSGPIEIQAGETPQDHAAPGRYEASEDAGHESGG
jgi:hypothetical protein